MDRLPITSWHRRAVVVVGLGLFFEIYEVFLAGVLSGVLSHRFHLGKSEVSMLLASAFFGMFLGALAFGPITDRLGRRFGFLLSLSVYSVFSLVGAFSVGPVMLVATRFLAGLGIGAAPPIADCYLADLLPANGRGRYTAWAYTLSFGGVPLAGFLGRWLVPRAPFGFEGWRWMFAVGALGAVVVFALRAALPESPRWLESVGRVREAEAIVERLELQAGADLLPEPDVRAPAPDQPGRRRQLLMPPYRRRTLMMMAFHLLQTWGYYGFGTLAPMVLKAKGFDIPETLLFSAMTFLGYPIGSALSVPVMERFERKHLVVGAAAGMAALGLGFGLATSTGPIVVCGLGYTLVSNIFSNTFHVYQAEIFPTQLRATAVGSAYSLSRLSSGLMPFVLVPLLHTRGPDALFAAVATALAIVAVDIGMFGPRTTGRALDGV
ncbi:MFS transporter [Mycobacterium parmense]|uniref:MFS transporter n=1 Tax=Mycobacterium parmense TaxID=185642 RepID=A0A7I7YTR8_9MYCO|nr:MFS transporter [Mycobacterium parmense]MCV7351424.1 MFS transporter [Mycobacterium parmense]ORW60937.1 MFS transporter [Mycobacterium parmense]BBZ45119.1 MFS transporter [Mycobacterium parmense]